MDNSNEVVMARKGFTKTWESINISFRMGRKQAILMGEKGSANLI